MQDRVTHEKKRLYTTIKKVRKRIKYGLTNIYKEKYVMYLCYTSTRQSVIVNNIQCIYQGLSIGYEED